MIIAILHTSDIQLHITNLIINTLQLSDIMTRIGPVLIVPAVRYRETVSSSVVSIRI